MEEDKKPETAAEKLARLEREREDRAKARAEAKKDADLEKLVAAEEAYAKLEEKHGPDNIRMTKTVCGPVIQRSPTDVQRRNFRKAQQTGVDQRAEAGKVLVTACVAHPDFDTFAAYVKEKPFIVDVLLEDLVELGGVVVDPKH